MAAFLNRLRPSSADPAAKKKDEPAADLTPLERLLHRAGPRRIDGTDKFYGLENFGNTCYCNSILQPLFFCEPFRHAVLNHSAPSSIGPGVPPQVRIRVIPNQNRGLAAPANQKMANAEAARRKHGIMGGQSGVVASRPEDRPEAPEYKKKQAMIKGPILELAYEDVAKPGSGDTTLTALQDIFRALIDAENRTGVLSPQRFLEIFKSNNESFRNSQHQDAHEFLGLVLNSLISTVDAHSKELRMRAAAAPRGQPEWQDASTDSTLGLGYMMDGAHLPMASSGWVHDIFEGVLTSETRCLACETASKRDETFLDLSIDLEEHTSVTSCLENFSAEEMLCERNKFHCDNCGSLQEAEKRMKVKRLPKVLALHLKRFKFTDDYTALNKLFHRVVYPSQLRLFNTTYDAGDPDRVYELSAVVIHIGPQAAQGHYVSVIKTKEWGWLLFDDEMVEPVDKDFVSNFFGGRPGQPCAYVLFYQEIDSDIFSGTQEASELEGVAKPVHVKLPATVNGNGISNGINGNHTLKANGYKEKADNRIGITKFGHAPAAPMNSSPTAENPATSATPAAPPTPLSNTFGNIAWKVWREHKAEVTGVAATEKLAKRVDEDDKEKGKGKSGEAHGGCHDTAFCCRDQSPFLDPEEKNRKVGGVEGADLPLSTPASGLAGAGLLGRYHRAYKPLGRRSFGFLTSKNGKSTEFHTMTETSAPSQPPGDQRTEHHEREKERLKDRFGFGLGRKKSTNMLSSGAG